MEKHIKVKTVIGLLGLFVLTKPMQMFPWGDYYLDLSTVAEQTSLTKYEILQRLPAIWEKDNMVL